MKENKDIEKILLNDKNYEDFINKRAEKEFENILLQASKSDLIIKDIKNLSKDKIFSKKSTFLVINKDSKTKSYVNGLQAEGMLGDQNLIREKLLDGKTDSFVNDSYFVKFIEFKE